MRIHIQVLGLLVLLTALPCLAEKEEGKDCIPAGVWYGGSRVAYFMTITPAKPAGHFMVTAQGMYKNSVMSTAYAGPLAKKGKVYEGPLMALTTQDSAYLGPPPYSTLPDLTAGWATIEMIDCDQEHYFVFRSLQRNIDMAAGSDSNWD